MRSSADFSSFARKGASSTNASNGKGGVANGKELLLSSSLPSAEVPGAFRRATEGGRAGGAPNSNNLMMNSSSAKHLSPQQPEQSVEGHLNSNSDHLAYLQGPMLGGGFNAKAAHLQRASAASASVTQEDIEGKGLMLQGADGHLYYQDLQSH